MLHSIAILLTSLGEKESIKKTFVNTSGIKKKIISYGIIKPKINKKKILRKFFTKLKVNKWSNLKLSDKRQDPTFLVGFPRSGTTLLDTILDSHPMIEVLEEKNITEKFIKQLKTKMSLYILIYYHFLCL